MYIYIYIYIYIHTYLYKQLCYSTVQVLKKAAVFLIKTTWFAKLFLGVQSNLESKLPLGVLHMIVKVCFCWLFVICCFCFCFMFLGLSFCLYVERKSINQCFMFTSFHTNVILDTHTHTQNQQQQQKIKKIPQKSHTHPFIFFMILLKLYNI